MGIRKLKPTTPGQRHKVIGAFDKITASTPEKSLVVGKKSTGGRNNTGKMTMRYIGGGHKQKYRIIDFPLSNCINSGVDTVGVLTQYQPLRLNTHIGIGIPWDLDRNVGGVTILPPYEKSKGSDWYTGTANAIFQNLEYMETYNPDYVLILSGDHIYKMDYEVMLEYHKANNADVTIAAMPVLSLIHISEPTRPY